jgi:D-threo-aldose 1-dehydrogenase
MKLAGSAALVTGANRGLGRMGIRDMLLNGPLGFGAGPLGNMFRDIPDHEAAATVDAAWGQGTRYFDTAPMYGAGL